MFKKLFKMYQKIKKKLLWKMEKIKKFLKNLMIEVFLMEIHPKIN